MNSSTEACAGPSPLVGFVLGAGAVSKVLEAVVRDASGAVADVMADGTGADPGLCHEGVDHAGLDAPEGVAKVDLEVTVRVRRAFQDFSFASIESPGSVTVHCGDVSIEAPHPSLITHFVLQLPSENGPPGFFGLGHR